MDPEIEARFDAAESIFFREELNRIKARTYERLYPEFKARQFIPADESYGEGDEVVRWQEYDKVGVAKIIASYADDLPMVEVEGAEKTSVIRSLGDAWGYNIQEVRAAAKAGRNLNERRAMAARFAIDKLTDDLLTDGDADVNLPGFVNNSNVPVTTVPNGADGTPEWSTKTAAEIRKDVTAFVKATIDATNGVEEGPFRLLLPIDAYTEISTRQNSDASDVTILQYILANIPWITDVQPWHKLAGKGDGGTDRGILYTPDPVKLEAVVPVEFEQFEAEKQGLAFKVPCHARCGGTIIHYPLSMRYIDDI